MKETYLPLHHHLGHTLLHAQRVTLFRHQCLSMDLN
jgi:hypothetical protein